METYILRLIKEFFLKTSNKIFLFFAIVNIILSIFVSAYLSHSNIASEKPILSAISMQQLHGLTIMILVTSRLRVFLKNSLIWVNSFFSLGLLFFCVNIYLFKFFDMKLLKFFTPYGGLFFLAGWFLLLIFLIIKFRHRPIR